MVYLAPATNFIFMKPVLALLTIILVIAFTCGCTTSAAATATPATTPAPVIPNLTGTWTGTTLSYDEGTGFTDYDKAPMSMVVTEQQGRIFAGTFRFTFNGTESSLPFAGVIGRNGRSFVIVERNNGYSSGEFVSENEIELTYLHDKSPFSASIDTLKRV